MIEQGNGMCMEQVCVCMYVCSCVCDYMFSHLHTILSNVHLLRAL